MVADALSRSTEENNVAWEGKVIPPAQLAGMMAPIRVETGDIPFVIKGTVTIGENETKPAPAPAPPAKKKRVREWCAGGKCYNCQFCDSVPAFRKKMIPVAPPVAPPVLPPIEDLAELPRVVEEEAPPPFADNDPPPPFNDEVVMTDPVLPPAAPVPSPPPQPLRNRVMRDAPAPPVILVPSED